MSPTQRTLAVLRRRGALPAVVERWNPHARIRQDLYGFVDLVVMDDEPGLLAIQATAAGGSERQRKIEASPLAVEWLKRGLRLQVWSWRKLAAYKKDGTRAKRDRRVARVVEAAILDGELVWGEAFDVE